MEVGDDNFPLPNKKDPSPSADDQERDAPAPVNGADVKNQQPRRRSNEASKQENSGSGGDDEEGGPRKRKGAHRRGCKSGKRHRGNWKPYSKMTWEERQASDERESRRATQKRAEREASGKPMAPYNTTQFLMNEHPADHLQLSPPLLASSQLGAGCPPEGQADLSGSMDSSDEFSSPEPDAEPDSFLEKEFADTYRSLHAERLQNLTKDELIREYLDLEAKVERLEEEKVDGQVPITDASMSPTTANSMEDVSTQQSDSIVDSNTSEYTPSTENHVCPPTNGHVVVELESELEKLRHECAQLRKDALEAEEAKVRAENRAQRLAGLKMKAGDFVLKSE